MKLAGGNMNDTKKEELKVFIEYMIKSIGCKRRIGLTGGRGWLYCRRPCPRSVQCLGLGQLGQDRVIGDVRRGGSGLDDELGEGIEDDVAFVRVEELFRGLAAEAGVWIGRVKVHVMKVVNNDLVLVLQAKKVHLGGHVGGVDDVQAVGDQLWARACSTTWLKSFWKPSALRRCRKRHKVV